jgi:hypothetical protein
MSSTLVSSAPTSGPVGGWQGGQRTLVPLAPQTVRAIDAALGGRTDGPLLVSNGGGRLDRHDAARIVARLARTGRAG